MSGLQRTSPGTNLASTTGNIICSFIILVQPEWSLHMKTALYHKLIDHENIRLLDRTYSVRIFQGPDAGKIAFASNELQELSQPLVLLCDIGSFLVVCLSVTFD
jgi:hypothetical protein